MELTLLLTPIFFPDTDDDESWGHPDNITHPTGCPGPPCYYPKTREKYWGSAAALVNAGPIFSGENVHLERLLSDDLSYKLEISRPIGASVFVSGGPHPDKETATVPVVLPGSSWKLSVFNPRQGQILKLRDGLVAMVVVLAFILSGLLLLLLLCSRRASVLHQEQLVTNKLLQKEKESREALLNRQFDLIACFEKDTKHIENGDRSKLSDKPSLPGTLERIASAESTVSEQATEKEEDVEVQQLLNEGSFGKVYRGKWRCLDVAVKITMLLGKMSGREKREKMVVWEAAISSSLVHPNVCQTYHYRIKPVKESARSVSEKASNGCIMIHSDKSCSRPKSGTSWDGVSSPEEVHSYEVQLILEYCDRSSLRDALDAGMFMTSNGMNYAAQLDCAMEVARAMLYLHCNNVLHLDLKTRNVLLASSGAEGKGVTCKVSDFGLSVCMDSSETHVSSLFQGTMTHMAPEMLLKGTCSEASDVYAFGIVLWELYTGGSPFRDMPPVLLGHSIVKDGKRPTWPAHVPKGYRDLANACWDQNPDARPSFVAILKELQLLRNELGHPTAPLQPYPVQQPQGQLPQLHFQLQSCDSSDLRPAKGPSPTHPQAACFEDAWQQIQGKGGTFPDKGLSTHAVRQGPMCSSAPHPAFPGTSIPALGLTDQGGTVSASLKEEEEGTAQSTNLMHGKTEQEGLDCPKSRAREGGLEPSCDPNTPAPPMPYSFTTSALSTTPVDQLSHGPGGAHSGACTCPSCWICHSCQQRQSWCQHSSWLRKALTQKHQHGRGKHNKTAEDPYLRQGLKGTGVIMR
ncbi:kinase-like domain-containing protein [Dunaliella salina]|uniref:Kinase-like domain-containing protein n=1 Tax=Dunaliella salina TaxID=3046 RepID=A0ABQ7GSU3_DUNSA|nr:kinase-like domain-containing protein [Dunaliella salina]|eukprot:KAF5837643.1 kinase-like domain-containing protein [Dunaliella salina]